MNPAFQSGQNFGLPALYRPSTADTCFVTSLALSPFVQTSASLLGTFACTTFRAFKLCTMKKSCKSTCLSHPRPRRCITPKAALPPPCTTVLHDCPTSRITDTNSIASAVAFTKAYSSDSAEDNAMGDCVWLLMYWHPCMRTPPLMLRLSDAFLAQFASLWAVSISCSSLNLHSYTRLGQLAKNRSVRFSLDQSRTVGLDSGLQQSLAPNCSLIRSWAKKFARAHKD